MDSVNWKVDRPNDPNSKICAISDLPGYGMRAGT